MPLLSHTLPGGAILIYVPDPEVANLVLPSIHQYERLNLEAAKRAFLILDRFPIGTKVYLLKDLPDQGRICGHRAVVTNHSSVPPDKSQWIEIDGYSMINVFDFEMLWSIRRPFSRWSQLENPII